jgi:hypothetical protein
MDDQGDADRRLARSAMAFPDLAKLFAGGSGRRVSPRRVAVAAGAVAAGALLVWAAIAAFRPGHEAAELDTSDYLAPLDAAADPSTGEVTAAFDGFAVSVESEPPGAIVTVAGVPRGEAPVLAGVDCRPGKGVEIRAEKAGFAAATSTTRCRKDTLVKLTLRLSR